VARLKLLDEVVHGLFDKELGGVVLLCGALLIGRVAAVGPLRRIFPVRRGVAAFAGCVRHDVRSPVLPAEGRMGRGVAGRERTRMDGERKTPASSAVAAREGWSILPPKDVLWGEMNSAIRW